MVDKVTKNDHTVDMLATLKQMAELVDIFRTSGVKQTYRKGDYIVRPGDGHHDEVFYITEGLVKAYDITKYNEENLLIIRKTDEIFPIIRALTNNKSNVIYQALAPTTTLKISRKTFIEHIENNPETLAPLLDMTVEMYRLHSERILNLEYRTVRERIISFLLTMSERFGKDTAEGLLIEAPLRHQDIASSVNATRETASRELSALERKGLIINKQSQITLVDIPALKKYLS